MNFSDFGDYAADYAALAVEKGFAEIQDVEERVEQGFAFFGGGGPSARKTRTARVICTQAFAPNPNFAHEVDVGSIGYCPADWVGR
jgi:hypothetical protein